MPKYRKKPVIINAELWDGSEEAFVRIALLGSTGRTISKLGKDILRVDTLEGVMRANLGDYIIEGVNGETYPCKPDIFEKTYEPIWDKECIDNMCDHIFWKDRNPPQCLNCGKTEREIFNEKYELKTIKLGDKE